MKAKIAVILLGGVFCAGRIEAADRAPQPQLPSWLDLEVRLTDAQAIASLYQDFLTKELPPEVLHDPIAMEQFRASVDYRFIATRLKFNAEEPDLSSVTWTFGAPDGTRWPTQATQLSFPDPTHYKARVILLCASKDHCENMERVVRNMPAPRPFYPISGPAPAEAQWEDLVIHEGCAQGPTSTPSPIYPWAAYESKAEGTVVVVATFNPCGEVRAATVQTSSRNRDLDRAAIKAVSAWRIDPPSALKMKHEGGKARIPVAFHFDDAPPAPETPSK